MSDQYYNKMQYKKGHKVIYYAHESDIMQAPGNRVHLSLRRRAYDDAALARALSVLTGKVCVSLDNAFNLPKRVPEMSNDAEYEKYYVFMGFKFGGPYRGDRSIKPKLLLHRRNMQYIRNDGVGTEASTRDGTNLNVILPHSPTYRSVPMYDERPASLV